MAAVTPEVIGRNFEITPDIRQLLESKLDRIEERLFDDVITVRVVLQSEKYRNICEILIVGKEHDVKAVQESGESMQDAINAALDHVKRQAQKNREKIRDHHKSDSTRFVDVAEGVGDAGPREATMEASSNPAARRPRTGEIADIDTVEREARR